MLSVTAFTGIKWVKCPRSYDHLNLEDEKVGDFRSEITYERRQLFRMLKCI